MYLCWFRFSHVYFIYSIPCTDFLKKKSFRFYLPLQQYAAEQQFIQTSDNLVATRISLKLQLQSSHFHGSPPSTTGGLTLKCIAEIPNLYYLESSELELGVPQRDPVPARGKCACHLLNLNIHYISIQIGWLVDCGWLYVFHSVLCPFPCHAMPHCILCHLMIPGVKFKILIGYSLIACACPSHEL